MDNIQLISLAFIVAVVVVSLMHPLLVKVAKAKNIVDNPNPRKLQCKPVPVLGGVGVVTGLLITFGLLSSFYDSSNLNTVFAIIYIMLFIGVVDDILDLRADYKLVIQFCAIALLMGCGGYIFNNLRGLFGIYELPDAVAIGLTIIGCTGMITAVNFIDGVDGLVSGYGIMVSVACGIVFYLLNDISFAVFSIITAGALCPFFIHNVFGNRLKMFFGDGGSMALGVIFSILLIHLLQIENSATILHCPVGFIIALFSVVLFDGFRVIIYRFKNKKIWESGRHHLHHFFIDFGFSHFATTGTILLMNISVLIIWYITSYYLSWSDEVVVGVILIYGFSIVLAPALYHQRLSQKLKKIDQ